VRTACIIVLMMEAVRTSETSVYSNNTAQHYTTEGSNFPVLILLNLLRVHEISRSHGGEYEDNIALWDIAP
jgi:hypothetical protein